MKLCRKLGRSVLSNDAQSFFLDMCINDEIFKLYPPSWLYVRRTLKEIILAAEKDGEEVSDGLYELHAIYLLPPQDGSSELASKCYKTFTYTVPPKSRSYLACQTDSKKFLEEDEQLVTLRVSSNMLEGGTGCSTWPAGLLLSEFVLSHPELFFGKNCLEVGAGTGMVGVLLARIGTGKIMLTDGSLATLANLKNNLSINNVEVEEAQQANSDLNTHSSTRVECRQLTWETLFDKERNLDCNVILGADLIYDPLNIPPLVNLLASLLPVGRPIRTNGLEQNVYEYPVAFIASAIRNPDTLVYFVETVRKAGLKMAEVGETMRPAICLTGISDLDRSTILIHKIQAWKD